MVSERRKKYRTLNMTPELYAHLRRITDKVVELRKQRGDRYSFTPMATVIYMALREFEQKLDRFGL